MANVDVKGVGLVGFPDDMGQDEIGAILKSKAPELKQRRNAMQGFDETVATVGSSIIAEPISGIAGIIGTIAHDADTGADWVKKVQQALTYQPKSEAGQENLQAIGSLLDPVAETIEGAQQKLGNTVY